MARKTEKGNDACRRKGERMEEGVRVNPKAAAGTDLSAKRPVKVPGAS